MAQFVEKLHLSSKSTFSNFFSHLTQFTNDSQGFFQPTGHDNSQAQFGNNRNSGGGYRTLGGNDDGGQQ